MKKLLIVGGNGYLGNKLKNYLENKHYKVDHTSRKGSNGAIKFDLVEPKSILKLDLQSYDTAFISAAISSPDICTNEFEYAWKVNVTHTAELINLLLRKGLKIIFFSSDTVYGEQIEPFDESINCKPLGKYALMKRQIEEMFQQSDHFKAIRLSYVFSKNDKFTKYLLDVSSRGETAEVFHPLSRSVIYVDDVLEGVKNISENWENINSTFINFGGNQNLSRIDFVNIIKKNYLRNLKFIEMNPNDSFFESRARIINMNSPILKEILKRDSLNFAKAVEKEFLSK